jgi:hypothetical protein
MTPEERRAWVAQRFREDLLSYRAAHYAAGVQIIAGAHPCPYAAVVAGAYRIDAAPVFPPADCTCELGSCCCWWEIIFNDDTEPVAWKTAAHVHPDAGPRIDREAEPLTMERLLATGAVLGADEASVQEAARNAGLLPKDSAPAPGLVASIVRAVKRLLT